MWEFVSRAGAVLLARRAGDLDSPRGRATLARSLRRIEREARGAVLPGPVPINRRAIGRHLGLIRALELRLGDHERPVSARGVLLADRLLTEPGSPLYSPADDALLAQALTDVLAALESAPEGLAA